MACLKRVFLVDGLRSPIGSLSGSLSTIRPDDLLALLIQNLVGKYPEISWNELGDVIIGCANQAGEDNRNIARMSLLLSGLSLNIPGKTVNRLCGSGLTSIIDASRYIQVNDSEIMLAGGVEHMTRSPYVLSKSTSLYDRNQKMYDSTFGWRFINPKMESMYGVESMGHTAENICRRMKISREDQELFSYHSQQKAKEAHNSGRLSKEILPITISENNSKHNNKLNLKDQHLHIFQHDEFMKPNTTLENLSKLKPAFGGTITAGTASGLNDGAGIVFLASEESVLKYNLKPLARYVGSSVVGCKPSEMGLGPVEAVNKLLKQNNLNWNQIDVLEINEAFAGQVLGCLREWGISDNDSRINPNGGAIALGHPLGMSGTRIALSTAIELSQNQNKRYGIATMCVGVGQGVAMLLERC